MRKLITSLLIIISLAGQAQDGNSIGVLPQDTTATDTVYVLSKADAQMIVQILRENGIKVKGRALSFDEVLQFIQYIEKRMVVLPRKEQPKN